MPIISNFPGGSGGSQSGVALSPVNNIKTIAAHEKVYIKWSDPADTVLEDVVLAPWEGTILVRKAGSMPMSRKDGVIVLDSKERDAYKNEYFCDNGLADGVTYYYKFFPYTKSGVFTDSDKDAFSVTPNVVYLGDISNASADIAGNGKMAIRWTDPDTTVSEDGITLATWSNTDVAVKTGSYATSIDDPGIVYYYSSYIHNGYATNPLVVTGLENCKKHYVTFFPISMDDAVTVGPANRVSGMVDRFTIQDVPSPAGSLSYTGNPQTPTWNNYNSAELSIDGDITGTNAQTYTAVFTPKKDYKWADGSTKSKSVEWSITKATINVPTTESQFVYDGKQKSPQWTGYDSSKMTMEGDNTGTNAGTYSVTFTPGSNYQWTSGGADKETVSWSIGRAAISDAPSQSGTLTYTGSAQSPSWSNYDSAKLSLGGVYSGTNAESYNATFTPTSNYKWSDNTTSAKTVSWSIKKKRVAKVTAPTTSWTYNGNAHIPSWSGYDANTMTMGGTNSAQTDVGSYSTTFTPNSNHEWTNGTSTEVSIPWSISKLGIADPSANTTSFVYTGSSQGPTFTYDTTYVTIGGDSSKKTNAGSYSATFTLKDTKNTMWSDNTIAKKNISWNIEKASGNVSLSTYSVTLDSSHPTASVTVTRDGSGTITATSNNTSVATASVSGTTVTISHVNQTNGSAKVTISVDGDANHSGPVSGTVSVEANFMPALNDYTWAQIREVSKNNQGANYWSVGDRKAITIEGTVGTLSVNGTYYVYILGFNHNSSKEGNGIHFGGFKNTLTGGTDICLIDSLYNTHASNTSKCFNINHSKSDTNAGGWKGCDMRYDILGSTKTKDADAAANTATSPVANTLMAAFPSDLRAVMQPMTKYTDNVGGGNDTASNVTKTIDYLPLLSEFEIFGALSCANSAERDYQAQYTYYSSGNPKVKCGHSSTGSAANWWERSPHRSDITSEQEYRKSVRVERKRKLYLDNAATYA